MAYVYLIEFPKHNSYYVGKTTREPVDIRIKEHFQSNVTKGKTDKLCRWYQKNKIKTINTVLEVGESKDIDYLEVFWIRYLKYLGFELTNHHDEETKSISWTEERKHKMSEFRKNHKFTDETKCKMSKSKKGWNVTWGDKISKTKKGKPNPFSKTHLENLRKSRIEKQSRKVAQMDLEGNILKEFSSIKGAAEYMKEVCGSKLKMTSLRNGIKDCCTGKQKTSTGFKWKYL